MIHHPWSVDRYSPGPLVGKHHHRWLRLAWIDSLIILPHHLHVIQVVAPANKAEQERASDGKSNMAQNKLAFCNLCKGYNHENPKAHQKI